MSLEPIEIIISANADDLRQLGVSADRDFGRVSRSARDASASLDRMAQRATSNISQMSTGFSRLNSMSGEARARFQNVGFPVQDMAVQIGAGTSAIQAMSQQLPQLAGSFGPLGIAIGTVAAVALPLLAVALGGAIGNTRTFADALDELDGQLSETKELVTILGGDLDALRERFGSMTAEARALAEVQAEGALRSMADAVASLRGELTDMYDGSAWLNLSRAEDLANAFRLNTQESNQLAAAMRQLNGAGSLDEQLDAARNLRLTFESMSPAIGDMTSEQFAFWSQIVDTEAAMMRVRARTAELSGAVAAVSRAFDAVNSRAGALGGLVQGAASSAWNLARGLAAAAQARAQAMQSAQAGMVYSGRGADPRLFGANAGQSNTFNVPNFSMPAVAPSGSGGGGGGGGGGGENPLVAQVEALRNSLVSQEQLQLDAYATQQEQLQQALEQKLVTHQEYASMIEAAQQKHQEAMSKIDVYRYGTGLQQAGQFMGDMAGALQSGNEQMQRIARTFGAAEALINAWRAASQTLADPSLPFFAKFAAASKVLASGMGMVNAIRAGGRSSASVASGGSTGSSAGAVASTGGSPAAPLDVRLSGIGANDLFSGRQLETLLDRLSSAAGDRGYRLMVAR